MQLKVYRDPELTENTNLNNEDVNKLTTLDDTIKGLQQQVELIKNQFIADNADKINGYVSADDFSSPVKLLVRNRKTIYLELAVTSAGEPSVRSPMVSHSMTPHR